MQYVWNTFVAKLDVQIVAKKLIDHKSLDGVSITRVSSSDKNLGWKCNKSVGVFSMPSSLERILGEFL